MRRFFKNFLSFFRKSKGWKLVRSGKGQKVVGNTVGYIRRNGARVGKWAAKNKSYLIGGMGGAALGGGIVALAMHDAENREAQLDLVPTGFESIGESADDPVRAINSVSRQAKTRLVDLINRVRQNTITNSPLAVEHVSDLAHTFLTFVRYSLSEEEMAVFMTAIDKYQALIRVGLDLQELPTNALVVRSLVNMSEEEPDPNEYDHWLLEAFALLADSTPLKDI